jgi:hypothetical protein
LTHHLITSAGEPRTHSWKLSSLLHSLTLVQEIQFFSHHRVPQWINLFPMPIVAIDLLMQYGRLWDE